PGRGEGASKKARVFGWIAPSDLHDLAALARKLTAQHHQKAPLDRGIGLETLRRRLGDRCGEEAAEEAIRVACSNAAGPAGEPLVVDGAIVRVASFGGAPATGAVFGALGRATRALQDAALKGVTEHAVQVATGSAPREVKAILAKLVRENAAVHAGDLWF